MNKPIKNISNLETDYFTLPGLKDSIKLRYIFHHNNVDIETYDSRGLIGKHLGTNYKHGCANEIIENDLDRNEDPADYMLMNHVLFTPSNHNNMIADLRNPKTKHLMATVNVTDNSLFNLYLHIPIKPPLEPEPVFIWKKGLAYDHTQYGPFYNEQLTSPITVQQDTDGYIMDQDKNYLWYARTNDCDSGKKGCNLVFGDTYNDWKHNPRWYKNKPNIKPVSAQKFIIGRFKLEPTAGNNYTIIGSDQDNDSNNKWCLGYLYNNQQQFSSMGYIKEK